MVELVKLQRDGNVRILLIDNPPLNILNPQVLSELETFATEVDVDDDVKGLVITGAGEAAFSAGADIKHIQQSTFEKALEFIQLGRRVFSKIEKIKKPTIAAVNGVAFGGGAELALSCDIRIASEKARFAQPEIKLGFIPGWGGTQRLSRLVRPSIAKKIIFTGEPISARDALNFGLVDEVVEAGNEVRAASALIETIISNAAPLALYEAKNAIDTGLQKPSVDEGLSIELEAVKRLLDTEDLREGMLAFKEKRKPFFKGR